MYIYVCVCVYFFFFLQLTYPSSACVMFPCGIFLFAMIAKYLVWAYVGAHSDRSDNGDAAI